MLPFLHRASPKTTEENPLWLVVLCDIMTNLMLFFLVLYVFTRQPDEARQQFIRGLVRHADKASLNQERVDKLVQRFEEDEASRVIVGAFLKTDLKELTEVEVTERQIRVRLEAPVLFKSGEAQLSPRAQQVLRPIGKLLASLRDEVVVEGHTDNIPISRSPYRTNWELSIARAHAVVQHLSGTFHIPDKRFVVAGYGEFRPVADNRTPRARARNRRIEIVVLRGSA